MMDAAIKRSSLFKYGFLALPVAFAGFPLYVLAPDFYSAEHGVSLTILGLVLLGLRLFDALQDPIIGYFSDRYYKKSFAVMFVSALMLVGCIYALFHPPSTFVVIWFAFFMAAAVSAYSVLSINLSFLGALWTQNSIDQTRISSMREAFGLIGLLLAISLPPLLKNILPDDKVYTIFSLILLGVMCCALYTFYRWLLQISTFFVRKDEIQASITHILRTLPLETKRLFFVYGLSVLASSIPAILVIFFVRDRLGAQNYLGVFLLLYFLSGALGMPLWKWASISIGKYQAWFFSMLLAVSSFLWAFFLSEQDIYSYAVICLLSGLALGADLVLPPSLLADHVHAHSLQNQAATQYSLLTLLSKAALAIGSVLVFPLLDVIGFIPAASNDPKALLGLSAAYALIPCFIKLIAAAFLYRYFIQNKGFTHENSIDNLDRSHTHAR